MHSPEQVPTGAPVPPAGALAFGAMVLRTLAIEYYPSLRHVALRLGPLTVVTGPTGAGKSILVSVQCTSMDLLAR